tara:strand:+ start:8912 stop:10504 length:1593 start_codon:yes stop_codon:yes gene_type:complete
MKLKINESKIRKIVNEEMLKHSLTKSLSEATWPTYTAYLGAEILALEWDRKTLQEEKDPEKPFDDGDDEDEKCDYVDCEGEGQNESLNQPSPEWIAEVGSSIGLTESEIAEATQIMQLNEAGVKGFFKALAKPYVNLYKTFTNITQHAADLTDPSKGGDPENKDDVQAASQVAAKMPEPAKLQQAASNPDDLLQYMKQILAILQGADSKIDGDALEPGMEDQMDQGAAALQQATEKGAEAAGGDEAGAGGGEAFVYRGKGGKGLQSFLARGASTDGVSLKGPAMGAVLKHIAKQLKSQGVTVNEGVLDEVQGWIWHGLVEDAMQQHYGALITLEQIAEGAAARGEQGSTKKGDLLSKLDAHLDSLQTAEEVEQFKATAEQGQDPRGEAKFNKGGAKKVRNYYTKFGGVQKIEDKLASLGSAAQEPGAEEAAPEKVEPTVQNTAPEGAPLVKVFKGKGGEGLQSALARSRDKLGIDQQTVASIIKSVEKWAQQNQIRVENIDDDGWDAIVSEIAITRRARKLQETINKLKS